jgi:hypothetical protein
MNAFQCPLILAIQLTLDQDATIVAFKRVFALEFQNVALEIGSLDAHYWLAIYAVIV